MIRRFTALAAVATLGSGIGLAAASAAPAIPMPKGWARLGGLNDAAYCASASPRMGVTVAKDDVNWDCTLTVRLPRPPGSVTTFKYQITQTDVCRWEYPSHASKVKAIDTTASLPAHGWACYIPVV